MKKANFPPVILPKEFVQLLKMNLTANSAAQVFEVLRVNRGLTDVLEIAFKEFNDGRGLEKTMIALGWENFRDRVASIYIYKAIHGKYPLRTDMGLIEDIRKFESAYTEMSVSGHSRAFLLGFYLRMAQLKIQELEKNKFIEVKLPEEVIVPVLRLTTARTEKIDWVILLVYHLGEALGMKSLTSALMAGKGFDDLYAMMPQDDRRLMHDNLLSYGMSIQEPEIFLYEKV